MGQPGCCVGQQPDRAHLSLPERLRWGCCCPAPSAAMAASIASQASSSSVVAAAEGHLPAGLGLSRRSITSPLPAAEAGLLPPPPPPTAPARTRRRRCGWPASAPAPALAPPPAAAAPPEAERLMAANVVLPCRRSSQRAASAFTFLHGAHAQQAGCQIRRDATRRGRCKAARQQGSKAARQQMSCKSPPVRLCGCVRCDPPLPADTPGPPAAACRALCCSAAPSQALHQRPVVILLPFAAAALSLWLICSKSPPAGFAESQQEQQRRQPCLDEQGSQAEAANATHVCNSTCI